MNITLFTFFLLLTFVSQIVCDGRLGEKHIKTVHVRYAEGWHCRKAMETKDSCQRWAFGESIVDVKRGDRASYKFNTTEHKGFDDDKFDWSEYENWGESAPSKYHPILVGGVASALWIEALDYPKFEIYWVSGLAWNYFPYDYSQQIWIQEGKFFRMDLLKSDFQKFTDFRYVEFAIFGENPRVIEVVKKNSTKEVSNGKSNSTSTPPKDDTKKEQNSVENKPESPAGAVVISPNAQVEEAESKEAIKKKAREAIKNAQKDLQ